MTKLTSVADFQKAIKASWDGTSSTVREHLSNLLIYAGRVERLAKNRPPRIKPGGKENAAYYENLLKGEPLKPPLRDIVSKLLEYVKEKEASS